MRIVFDLDGTLICSKRRLYELFCFLVGHEHLTFSRYWDLKFSGQTNKEILRNSFGFSDPQVDAFVKKWMFLIEDDQYLALDTVIEGVPRLLSALSKKHDLYLCTARQSANKAHEQLDSLALKDHFKEILVTEQRSTKEELLKTCGVRFGFADWMIGDTGHDILTGKALGMKTCAVLSGFMSEASLVSYKPDSILPFVSYFEIDRVK